MSVQPDHLRLLAIIAEMDSRLMGPEPTWADVLLGMFDREREGPLVPDTPEEFRRAVELGARFRLQIDGPVERYGERSGSRAQIGPPAASAPAQARPPARRRGWMPPRAASR